jgi:hypothetical protein
MKFDDSYSSSFRIETKFFQGALALVSNSSGIESQHSLIEKSKLMGKI